MILQWRESDQASEQAILVAEDGRRVPWPLAWLPAEARVGAELVVEIKLAAAAAVSEQERLAKDVLNEIFNV